MTHSEPRTLVGVHCINHFDCLQDIQSFPPNCQSCQMFSPEPFLKVFPFCHFTTVQWVACVCVWNISNEFKLNPEPSDERRSCQGKRIKVSLCANPFISMVKTPFVLSILCPVAQKLPEKIKNCYCHGTNDSHDFNGILICINSVLYWLKYAVGV